MPHRGTRFIAVRTPRILALSRWAIGIALALFVLAMALYPGGTVNDASTSGYDFFRNFGSDLGRTVAFNGRPNRESQVVSSLGGALLMLGIVSGTVGLAAVYSASVVERLWSRAAVVAGFLATSSVLAAFLIPPNLDPVLHVTLASVGFDIAPVVPLCLGLATYRDRRFPVGVVAGWMLLALVLAWFVALRMPDTSGSLIVRVTAQKMVFIAIAATYLYESFQAERAATRRGGS
jgi:hypothetical protein